jgi:hypothetical protein
MSPSGVNPTELISIHHVSTEALTPLLEGWTGGQALSHGWGSVMLADPQLEPGSSYQLFYRGDLRGWIPVHRLNERTITITSVLHDSGLFTDEPHRKSLLRLAAWSHALRMNLSAGQTVISWVPDDGDPINQFKFEVGAPAWTTHWVTSGIRRDLTQSSS